ncbi:SipW-dependent-type signal peptide-containing protein [Bacillus sp. FJAT-49711]|uniref:TasA family protein n=1 Tax=Bacillus sp. FJAT-49711 TaxID=2833585 RepID=UPI001BC9592E|nr:TasA family protein [Bacillus sp. FJAT-49711]MBS4219461.1 SipW-dependent-type signal peptide-containing protein [Bacillus sp. FJAT-49711]
MSIKKKLGLGLASAALGLSLVGGGTFAYFNDVEVNNSSFAAGTLDINVTANGANNAIIDVGNLKPGDIMTRTFKLNNIGSLDVSKVLLTSKYTVTDAKGDNAGADFGEHIKVKFLINNDKRTEVVHETTLKNLSKKDVVERDVLGWLLGGESSGLQAGKSDTLSVMFEFVDNKADQNVFQDDSLKLEWTFDAKQTTGSIR